MSSKDPPAKVVCLSLCPALLTEACVFEAPGGHTKLLLSSVHTCTTIAVMLAKTGTDKVITHTGGGFPRFPSYSVEGSAVTQPLLMQNRKWFMSLMCCDLLECKGGYFTIPSIVNRGPLAFNIIYKSGRMERFSYCSH